MAEREFNNAETNPTLESVRIAEGGPVPNADSGSLPSRANEPGNPNEQGNDSPWQTVLRLRVPKRVGRRGVAWTIAGAGALLLLASAAHSYRQRWNEAESLRSHNRLARLSDVEIQTDWNLFRRLRARDSWLGKFSPAAIAAQSMLAAYISEGDRIIDSYRQSQDSVTTNFDWARAQTVLEHAQELDPADIVIRGKLALVKGYVNLNLAIVGPQIAIRQHMQDRVIRSWHEFDQASILLPKSPDPYLGLGRLYVYSFRDLDKAIEEWNKAEQRQYKLGPREIEQEADGFRLRAQKEMFELHDRNASKEDLVRAKDLYTSIHDYDDIAQRLRIVAQDERVLDPPPVPKAAVHALPHIAAKPAVRKSAKPARRAQTWQSPKAGKRRKN